MSRKSKLYWGVLITVAIIILISALIQMSYHISEEEIAALGSSIVGNESDLENQTNRITSWIQDNVIDVNYEFSPQFIDFVIYYDGNSYHSCLRNSYNPDWVFNSRCGRCGELSYIFYRIAKSVGIETRIVRSVRSWNHAWIEVFDGTRWVTVNPRHESGFNDTFDFESGWNVTISCLLIENPYGHTEIHEELNRYTETNKLIVNISSRNHDGFVNIPVIIKQDYTHTIPCDCITDSNGMCMIELGDGIYSVTFSSILVSYSENIMITEGGESVLVNFNYRPELDFLIGMYYLLLLIMGLIMVYVMKMTGVISKD